MVLRLIIFTALSISLIIGVLYSFLSHSMNREFQHRLQIHINTTESDILNRINSVKSRVRFLAMDNSVRISLMLGVKSQIIQLVERQYKWENGETFFVRKIDAPDCLPELPNTTRKTVSELTAQITDYDTKRHIKNPNGLSAQKRLVPLHIQYRSK